jgi:sulfite reductase (NADPH) flavoprotein alpha-component
MFRHPFPWLCAAALLLTVTALGDSPWLRNPAVSATLVVLLYLAACSYWLLWQPRQAQRRLQQLLGRQAGGPATLIAYASQTGTAEQLAWQAATQLAEGGIAVEVLPLNEVNAARLQACARALFIASTYGEGDPPDNAALFARRVLASTLDLGHLHCGVLALGDRSYTHFCGFGHQLDDWLQQQGAVPLFDRLNADDSDRDTLAAWQAHLRHLGAAEARQADAVPWTTAHLTERRPLNPGSPAAPAFHLRLKPAVPLHWQAGDILEIALPGQPALTREYSIASVPGDGGIDLLVRQVQHPDGRLGAGSGWLTAQASEQDALPVRIRRNPAFHGSDTPLVLIGAGTGLAGLRAHLRERAQQGRHDNWLLFGERTHAFDRFHQAELDSWLAHGHLQRLDQVFSRDAGEYRYVQDVLAASAGTLRDWLARGATILVCGSLTGMGHGVDHTLRTLLGDDAVDALISAGRYRRDLY